MGILDALKRLFSTNPEDALQVEKMDSEKIVRPYLLEEQKKSVEQQPTSDELVDDSLNHDFEADLAKIKHERQTTVQHEPTQLKLHEEESHAAIKQWEDTIKAAQQHPLSQVKIINSQILEELNHVLRSMDHRLEKLNDLEKLDFILELLQQTKEEIAEKGVSSQALDSAITHISQLTIKDKEVIDWVSRQERVTANQLADYINLSRSTASFRLNRLAELGALEKEAIGKKIYYKIKKG